MRFLTINSMLKIATVVVIALALGVTIAPRGPDIGAVPAPSASAAPEPTARFLSYCETGGWSGKESHVEPGRYVMTGGSAGCDAPPLGWPQKSVSVMVPEGWTHLGPGKGGVLAHDQDAQVRIGEVEYVTSDLCGAEAPVGPTVDDLIAALEAIDVPGMEATAADPVMLGGHPGKRVDVTVPTGAPDCETYTLLQTTAMNNGVWRFRSAPGWTHRLWILDVEGVRFVVDAMHAPDASAESVDEADRIVRSIHFAPWTAYQCHNKRRTDWCHSNASAQ
jgi:hypothetical protein